MPAFALNPFVLNMINSLARFDIQGILVTVLVLTISLSFHENGPMPGGCLQAGR
ncbi:MAG: hypothetical protein LRY35_03725 [Clostridiales bacterium]|nr:hypothetical protein [Clostridiales bacterium]